MLLVDEGDWLAERFQAHRSHLRAVAYRMLGSLSEADDAVQDAWLRLSRADISSVQNLGGWLTTWSSCILPGPGRTTVSAASRSSPLPTARLRRSMTASGRAPRSPASSRGTGSASCWFRSSPVGSQNRSEEHTSELQSRENLVCRLLLEKKKNR